MPVFVLAVVAAYLVGSISSAVLVCKLMGKDDPRDAGSGNPGTTNVLRLHGKKAAAVTLLGDGLKGFLPVLLLKLAGAEELLIALAGVAAFLGHLFPLFFGFRGGKGVATLLGVLFAMHWLLGLGFALTWLLVALLFRYSSLAALSAALLAPLYTAWLFPDLTFAVAVAVMAVLLFWRHQANIRNLLAGTESRIGGKRS